VVATGEAHSVREFLEEAFSYAGLDWERHVEIDPAYFRPTEVDFLLGDSSRTKQVLERHPETDFRSLVRMMVDADFRLAENERVVAESRYSSSIQNIGGIFQDGRLVNGELLPAGIAK
jgi:GDPmannose 4,6-dehydratase